MFYDTLKEVCRSHGTTPTAVCKSLSLSTGCVTSWKNGAVPNMSTVERIASHLSVPVTSLMSESSSSVPHFDLQRFASPALTPAEQNLLEAYRTDPAFRAVADAYLNATGQTGKKPASSEA